MRNGSESNSQLYTDSSDSERKFILSMYSGSQLLFKHLWLDIYISTKPWNFIKWPMTPASNTVGEYYFEIFYL